MTSKDQFDAPWFEPTRTPRPVNENLEKALQSVTFAREELLAALKAADPVSALVLVPMLGDVAKLGLQVAALIDAQK